MTKFWNISNIIVLGLLILICGLGTFYKHISFGLGLGDMFGYLVLYVGTIIHLILTIASRNKGTVIHIFLTIIFLLFAVLIALNATIWRGSEYRWNGSLFYLPCPTEIKIQNQALQKELLIPMCTMEYYSEFTGIWDGKFLTIKTGEIKVPEELEEYISRPIVKVEIEPYLLERIEKDKIIKESDFKEDTLQISKEYKLSGEISEIRNNIPVINAGIN